MKSIKTLIRVVVLFTLFLSNLVLGSNVIDLPQTGQINSYSEGDDGDLQKGIKYPNPRFTDLGNNIIRDNLTGLIWTKDANLSKRKLNWYEALDFVTKMNEGVYQNFGHSDWRLPNRKEMGSITDWSRYDPAIPHNDLFLNIRDDYYWTSTSINNDYAWIVILSRGTISPNSSKSSSYFIWPVRGDYQDGLIKLPKTGQVISYASGDDGNQQKGVDWPTPRFTDLKDGTIIDNLSGLIWTRDANLPRRKVNWYEALDFIKEMNSNRYSNFGYSDWRLPNIIELESLVNADSINYFPFINRRGGWYWSSTSNAYDPSHAWVNNTFGYLTALFKNTIYYTFLWPVRDGGFIISVPSIFFSEITNIPAAWNIRQNIGLDKNIIKIIPKNWIVKVINTIDDNGNNIDIDGYRWYQVQDVTDGTIGWMAAKNLTDGTVYLDYNQNNQSELQNKAETQLDTADKRKPVILDAVNNYYAKDNSDNSLYGGGGGIDGLNNFQRFITGSSFPKELTLAVASQESGGVDFDNERCSQAKDGGIGIMQITSSGYKGLGSGLDNKSHKNDCTSGYIGNLSKYYSNAFQGIYANIKDGFRVLQDKYNLVGRTKAVDSITAEEMKAISTVYRYNQGSPYKIQAVYEIWDGQDNNYIWEEYLRYVFSTQAEANTWIQKVKDACLLSTTFNNCLNKAENLKLTTSAFYLRDVGQKLYNSPFGQSYQNPILGDKLIAANNSRIILFLRSPAELRAINSLEETTGELGGETKQEIPNSIYDADKKFITIFFPQENYRYRVTGIGSGEYGLSVDLIKNDDFTVFDADNIPINSREIHDYTIDWDKMSRCEMGAVTLGIDFEGDGIFDRIIKNDCRLYDIEPPQISISPLQSEYLLNSQLQIQFSAIDNVSGIASIIATLNGLEIRNNQTVVLNKSGINTLRVVAIDNEGNEAILEKTFNVLYNFGGFLPPIKNDGTGIYNNGRTLPVKFQLKDTNGNFVSTAVAHFYIAKITNGIIGIDEIPSSTSAADADNIFRYDYIQNQYVYNLDTATLNSGKWQFKTILDSGQVIVVIISIK